MTAPFPFWGAPLPDLTAAEMREVDRVMVEDLGIELIQMMENAGRHLAAVALRRFRPETVTVLAGPGGNGGGGLVAARHLANRGLGTQVALAVPADDFTSVPRHQLAILERMGVAVGAEPNPAGLVIDAVIGYSLQGDPRGRHAELIEWANSQHSPVLALDNPSGLDVTTGIAADPCVTAAATMTLALPKAGLWGSPHVGELYLADISVPPATYAAVDKTVPNVFAAGPIVRVA